MQSASTILMIRPVSFGFNEQTADSNAFQLRSDEEQDIQINALKEFDNLVEILRANEVEVIVVEDTPSPHTPDSIFPNNWISTHGDGTVFLYPMQAENRRFERRKEILDTLSESFEVRRVNDLSFLEKEVKFLEGTGSMVLDRDNKIAYACLSTRTSIDGLNNFCRLADYQFISFNAVDDNDHPIYHTNVMMCLGDKFAVICLDTIKDNAEKKKVIDSLLSTSKEIVQISMDQLKNFAGNMIQLKNKKDQELLVMSQRAYHSLSRPQIEQLEKYCKILYAPLTTIEFNGGGSARCMIAEIHLSLK
jgi:hypothetical protein